MKQLLCILCIFTLLPTARSQYIHKIKADSVRIYNDSCNAELILQNSTRNVDGFLFNKGNGRTEFRKAMTKVNDNTFVFGSDTLHIPNTGTSAANNGIQKIGNEIQFGNDTINYLSGPANQIRPTIYNQNSRFFNWMTGDSGVFTVSKKAYGPNFIESNILASYYIARFASRWQGGILIENSFKHPDSEYAAPLGWINFKNNHPDAATFTYFKDPIVASIEVGTRIGTDDKVYSNMSFQIAGDTTYTSPPLRIFPPFTAKSGGPIRIPTVAITRLDITRGINGGVFNFTPLSYNNPYARLVVDAEDNPIVIGNLPTTNTSGSSLIIDDNGRVWKSSSSLSNGSSTYIDANSVVSTTAIVNFPSTTAGTSYDMSISVAGAADGDVISLGVPNNAMIANSCYTAWVSASNIVTIRFNNYSNLSADPAEGTFKIKVFK